MNRRRFLQLSAAGIGATVVVGPYFRGTSYGAAFGDFPAGAKDALLPEANRAKNVLEIFLYGGLSCWETLYLVEEFGRPNDPEHPNEQFYTFPGDTAGALEACGVPDLGGEVGQFFGQDADGFDVKLGPFAYRLWDRPDLTSRMRIVVQKHTLEPHEAAVPQALTGRPVGQPSAAGLGAHIQRYFGERADASRKAPFSYAFATGGISADNVSAAASTGVHPGMARPLLIKIDNADRFAELLGRGTVGADRANHDALMDVYIEQYRQRLRWEGAGEQVRSARFNDLSQGHNVVKNVDAIAGVMAPQLFNPRTGNACGQSSNFDVPGMSLNAARHLLTHPTEPARYVCVSDIGLYEASGGGGYDTHSATSYDTARNFDNMLRNLLSIINGPGESDPTKLNLDDTLIILNTEFGRTPFSQGDPQFGGRNHHPYGYTTVFLGGPITPDQQGIHGNIRADGTAQIFSRPAENRMAALLALGIWPFSPEAFAVSDIREADDEEDGALKAIEHYLGYAQ